VRTPDGRRTSRAWRPSRPSWQSRRRRTGRKWPHRGTRGRSGVQSDAREPAQRRRSESVGEDEQLSRERGEPRNLDRPRERRHALVRVFLRNTTTLTAPQRATGVKRTRGTKLKSEPGCGAGRQQGRLCIAHAGGAHLAELVGRVLRSTVPRWTLPRRGRTSCAGDAGEPPTTQPPA